MCVCLVMTQKTHTRARARTSATRKGKKNARAHDARKQRTLARREVARHELQQRRLARAVGADERDAAVAVDAKLEVLGRCVVCCVARRGGAGFGGRGCFFVSFFLWSVFFSEGLLLLLCACVFQGGLRERERGGGGRRRRRRRFLRGARAPQTHTHTPTPTHKPCTGSPRGCRRSQTRRR